MTAFWLLNDNPMKRAEQEWKRWIGFDESSPDAVPLLTKYWKSVGLPLQPASVPWSAAFISTIAAGYLKPSPNHLGYARAAWKDRQNGVKGRYWAYKPSEVGPLQKGDIVVKGRGQPVGWDDIIADTGHKDSHGDIVTETKGGLTLIGGNVGNSVTKTHVLANSVFAVLRKA